MAKKKMTYEIYSQKKEKLETRAEQLKKEITECEKKLKEVTEEINRIDEEYILLSFRNSGKSVAEYVGITKIETEVTESTTNVSFSNAASVQTVASNSITHSNSSYNPNKNFSGGLK